MFTQMLKQIGLNSTAAIAVYLLKQITSRLNRFKPRLNRLQPNLFKRMVCLSVCLSAFWLNRRLNRELAPTDAPCFSKNNI